MITHFRRATEEALPWLSSSGADLTGGMTRLLYSSEQLETQQQFKKKMTAGGLEARFDEMENLCSRLSDTEYPQEAVLSGLHTDTVVNDGNLDGQFGALAAWLATDWLKTQYGVPLRTVEAVAMAEKESSRFPYVFWGGKDTPGLANPDDVRNIYDVRGNSFVNAMKTYRFILPNAPLTLRRDVRAFVELCTERSCVLRSNGQSIDMVNTIAGQHRYMVTLNGESNHVGTTPVGYRRDTVYAFSRTCHQSVEKVKRTGDPPVLTFSKVEPHPNMVNVVPGKTTFTIDCRRIDATISRDFTQQLEDDMRATCDEMDIGIDIDLWMDEEPMPTNKELVATLTELCESEKLNYRVMHSGAGHDVQILASRMPTCMIFIPSVNGINRSPAGHTNITDLTEGVKTLALILYQLAWQE